MPSQSDCMIRQRLQEAAAAESFLESRLRELVPNGDDGEVRAAVNACADQAKLHIELLNGRLLECGSSGSDYERKTESFAATASGTVGQRSRIAEERTLQDLVSAYTLEAAASAFYERLAASAHFAADEITEKLSRQIQAAAQRAAEQLWHFIPSRSKIAFNMLTVQEVDPSVETKVADDRLIGT